MVFSIANLSDSKRGVKKTLLLSTFWYWYEYFLYPKQYTRISVSHLSFVKLVLPPLKSEKRWLESSGRIVSSLYFKTKRTAFFFFKKNVIEKFIFWDFRDFSNLFLSIGLNWRALVKSHIPNCEKWGDFFCSIFFFNNFGFLKIFFKDFLRFLDFWQFCYFFIWGTLWIFLFLDFLWLLFFLTRPGICHKAYTGKVFQVKILPKRA